MNEIRILISGIVLLLAQSTYLPNGSSNIGAAAAVAVPEEREGRYGITIARHTAKVVFRTNELLKDPVEPAGEFSRVIKKAETTTILLSGDHIQTGYYDPTVSPLSCSQFRSGNEKDDVTTNQPGSLPQIPSLTDLIEDTTLAATAIRAGRDDFTPLASPTAPDQRVIAGWLDMPRGRISAVKEKNSEGRLLPTAIAEFRPTRRQQELVGRVIWRSAVPNGMAACITIEPFDETDQLDITVYMKKQTVDIEYTNLPDEETGDPHTAIPYDFEMFYEVLANKPPLPPIPYPIAVRIYEAADPNSGHGVSGLSGVKCGPGKIQDSGDH